MGGGGGVVGVMQRTGSPPNLIAGGSSWNQIKLISELKKRPTEKHEG